MRRWQTAECLCPAIMANKCGFHLVSIQLNGDDSTQMFNFRGNTQATEPECPNGPIGLKVMRANAQHSTAPPAR